MGVLADSGAANTGNLGENIANVQRPSRTEQVATRKVCGRDETGENSEIDDSRRSRKVQAQMVLELRAIPVSELSLASVKKL